MSPTTLTGQSLLNMPTGLTAIEEQFTTGMRVYAIAFDMDTEALRSAYPTASFNNAYMDIRRVLAEFGFRWQQGSVYFGDKTVNAVTCVLAAQQLSQRLDWFAVSVRDIRMLRIEEMNDLRPAVEPLGE